MTLSILFALIMALATGFTAAAKNRTFIGWLVVGLLIPVFGFVLILSLPQGQDND